MVPSQRIQVQAVVLDCVRFTGRPWGGDCRASVAWALVLWCAFCAATGRFPLLWASFPHYWLLGGTTSRRHKVPSVQRPVGATDKRSPRCDPPIAHFLPFSPPSQYHSSVALLQLTRHIHYPYTHHMHIDYLLLHHRTLTICTSSLHARGSQFLGNFYSPRGT